MRNSAIFGKAYRRIPFLKRRYLSVQVTDFQVNISGERAEEYPQRYTDVHIEFVLQGKDIKPKAVEQAIQLSETKYCGAMASLNADFETTYRIVDE